LAKPLSNRQVDELHQVLFFRDQPVDIEAHKRLGRYFGELHIHPNTPGPEGHLEILPIHADANSKRVNGEYWHSDVSCDEEPPLGQHPVSSHCSWIGRRYAVRKPICGLRCAFTTPEGLS